MSPNGQGTNKLMDAWSNFICGLFVFIFIGGIIVLFLYGMSEVGHKNYLEQREKYGIYGKRDQFPIEGHPEFVRNIERVLQEAKDRAPHRYQEAMGYLAGAYYNPKKASSGTSNGDFSIDGTGNMRPPGSRYEIENSYQWLRFVFWHEVGHNVVEEKYHKYSSEEAANQYAEDVLRELGV